MKKFFALMTAMLLMMVTFSSCGDDGDDEPAPVAEYTIKYDPNGGTGTIANTTYKVGDKVTLSDGSGFTREGYAFTGWSDKADGTTIDVNAIANKNVTLYAVWTKVDDNGGETPVATEFTIKYNPNGGTGTIANTTYKVGDKLNLSDGTGFTREGYTFKGWSTSADGTEIDETAFTGKDITLYAVWEQDALPEPLVTITLDLDGGAFASAAIPTSFTVQTGTVIAADNEKLALLQPTKEGFTFKGWATEKGGAALTSFTADKDATLYAVWEQNAAPKPQFTVLARVENVEGKDAQVFGWIDGLAGRTDIDQTKINGFGFSVEPAGTDLSANSPQVAGQLDFAKGGFNGTITKEPGKYVFVAFVIYDGDVTVSAPVELTIEEAGNGGNVLPETLPAFFPTGYDKANVVAWYSVTTKDENEVRTESVFLFSDESIVVSKNQIKADGRVTKSFTSEYELMAGVKLPLMYQLTEGSTFENGTANVGVSFKRDAEQASIQNGVLTIEALASGIQYILQDNANIPEASDPTK